MSDIPVAIDGDRDLSPVASARRGLPRWQLIAVFGLVAAAIVSAVFWRDSNQRAREQAASQGPPLQMGQVAMLDRAMPAAFAVAAQPAPAPSLGSALREASAQPGPLTKEAPARHRMMSYAGAPAPSANAAPLAQPSPSASRTGIAFKASVIAGGKAGPAVDLTYMLMPGVVKCVLDNAIDTTQPGPIFCHLTADVFSPRHVLLLEKNTNVTGSYSSGMQQGQSRLPAVSAFALTPNGVPVTFGGAMGDALGRSGIAGEVDTHFVDRFGGALLLMTAQGAMSAASSALQHGNGNSSVNLNTGAVDSAVSEVLRNTMNIAPTVRVDQGSEVGLFVTMPIDFRDAYQLRETP